MPDDRRAWHRGGACPFNRQPVTARAHDRPARDIDVPRAAVSGVRGGHAAQYASLLRHSRASPLPQAHSHPVFGIGDWIGMRHWEDVINLVRAAHKARVFPERRFAGKPAPTSVFAFGNRDR